MKKKTIIPTIIVVSCILLTLCGCSEGTQEPLEGGATTGKAQEATASGIETDSTDNPDNDESRNSAADDELGNTTSVSQEENTTNMDDVWAARYDAMHSMYVGTWESYQGGEDTNDDGVLELYEEYEVTLTLNEDGTGSVVSYGNTLTFTWEAGSTMTGDATGKWDDFEDGSDYLPESFNLQMIDDDTITADLSGDGGTWIVYFRKDGYYDNGGFVTSTISDSEVRSLSDSKVYSMATEWKNRYNNGVSNAYRITNVHPRTFEAEVEYNDDRSKAVVLTEVEYWIGGGNPAGSVYAYVVIDCASGSIIESGIE